MSNDKNPKGYYYPRSFDMDFETPTKKLYACSTCKRMWYETSPGKSYINGPTYYDYCSECTEEQLKSRRFLIEN